MPASSTCARTTRPTTRTARACTDTYWGLLVPASSGATASGVNAHRPPAVWSAQPHIDRATDARAWVVVEGRHVGTQTPEQRAESACYARMLRPHAMPRATRCASTRQPGETPAEGFAR